MAYSDYGAFVWKNDKEITNECADKAYYRMKNGVWVESNELSFNLGIDLNTKIVEGHAVLDFGSYFLVFYKDYNPTLYNKETCQSKILELDKSGKIEIDIDNKKLTILEGLCDYLKFRYVSFDNDNYFIVCGGSVGKGYEKTCVSKAIKKYLCCWSYEPNKFRYDFTNKGQLIYDMDIIVNSCSRRDDIKHERYWRNIYIKDLIISMFKFKFNDASFDWKEICEHNLKIKYLK